MFVSSTLALIKTVGIAGANSGIGLAVVKQLLKTDSCKAILAFRDESKTLQAIKAFPAIISPD
ncbi:hypothetical protein EON65_44205 [archaeon]|nr:MAG: hypothetical protein EON65_44205 [archaeon]